VRVRRLVTLTVGAGLGAATMYLLDPEHGPERRRRARQRALAQARTGAVRALADARTRGQELALAAVAGYQASRTGSGDGGDIPPGPSR
jgi:hypothetical protein